MYHSPRNANEYWAIVDENWGDISHILDLFLPTFGSRDIDGTQLEQMTLNGYILLLKEIHAPRLARIFNAAWHRAPHDYGLKNNPAWAKFIDLCSEDYVLYEPKEEVENDDQLEIS